MSVTGPIRPRKSFKLTGPRRITGERMVERELNRRRKFGKQNEVKLLTYRKRMVIAASPFTQAISATSQIMPLNFHPGLAENFVANGVWTPTTNGVELIEDGTYLLNVLCVFKWNTTAAGRVMVSMGPTLNGNYSNYAEDVIEDWTLAKLTLNVDAALSGLKGDVIEVVAQVSKIETVGSDTKISCEWASLTLTKINIKAPS